MRQFLLFLLCVVTLPGLARAEGIRVFCAEALWCELASGLGGADVETRSILTSPRIDPHDFQVTPDMARALAESSIVVRTGGHYDDWIAPLLAAQPDKSRHVIDAVTLVGLKDGDNPHLFDDPAAIRDVVDALAADLVRRLPGEAGAITARQTKYRQAIDGIEHRLSALRPVTKGMKIAVAEPVGGPVFRALGLDVIDPDFAQAMMTHSDPAPQEVARLEDALRQKTVKILVVNPAMTGPSLQRLVAIARQSGVSIVEFDEFPVPGVSWQDWMTARLDRLTAVLGVHG